MAEHPAYSDLLEHVTCNLCGADDYEVVHPSRYDSADAATLAEVFRSSGDQKLLDRMVRCRVCGLEYLEPRLRQDLILEAYGDGADEVFVSQVAARERTFSHGLDLIERYHPERGRILDVGTAGGSFLKVARDRGWEVAGCEPSRWLVDFAKEHYGLDVVPGTLDDMDLPDAAFDVVTLWDVLEHTPDPMAVLREVKRVMKPGGLLLVNYPDVGSLASKAMGRGWVFLLSVHLYYFDRRTISKMLSAAGLEAFLHRRHYQSLELGYIFKRARAYVAPLADAGAAVVRVLRAERLSVPYWMGQAVTLARLPKGQA